MRRMLKQMVRFNADRRRTERRVRDNCQRWMRLGLLATGGYVPIDGLTLLKSYRYDLYDAMLPVGAMVPFHPSWFQ